MTYSNSVLDVLAAGGLTVDRTRKERGPGDGKCWVHSESYDIDDVYRLSVVAAVYPGGDIDRYVMRVWSVLAASIYQPTSMAFVYGAAPYAGRDMNLMDYAEIDIVSPERWTAA